MGALYMNCRASFLPRPFLLAAGLALGALRMGGNGISIVLPVAAALPCAAAFWEELQSGFWLLALHRTTKTNYLLGKILACWLSGAAVILVGGVLALSGSGSQVLSLAYHCLSGGAFALLGMAASLITGSRAVAWFSPFLSEYLLVILAIRYLPAHPLLDPRQWPRLGAPGLLFPVGLACICGALCWAQVNRRLNG